MTVASWNVRSLGDKGVTSSRPERLTALVAKDKNCTGSGGPVQIDSPRGNTMRRKKIDKIGT